MMMTRTISSRESSCLANCSPLPLLGCFFVQSVQGANIRAYMTPAHRDRPAIASVTQWPEIQPLVSRGQIVSADLL